MSRCSVSHRRTILGCHAPDSDSNKIIGLDRKQGRTGPGQAKRVLRKRKRGIGGRKERKREEELLTTFSAVLLGLLICVPIFVLDLSQCLAYTLPQSHPRIRRKCPALVFLRLRFLFFLSRLMSRPSGSVDAVWGGVVRCGVVCSGLVVYIVTYLNLIY